MSKFFRWLQSLRQPLPWIVAGVILLFIVVFAVTVGATTWEYTNSPQFCGTTCHTMPPEYTAYQISPHARVACVDCHLGQESFLLTVPRKAREVSHVVNALTQRYEPPIYVKSLRPARDTCEQCHNPEKFSSDTFVEIKRYATDEVNTESRNYLVLKTGGGSRREGLGRGIHWHIEAEVWYYSDDPLKQTIPYVRELTPQGQLIEYFDAEAGLPSDFGQQVEDKLHRMDCIDCHTRISHLFRSPADALDDALARRLIDANIPYIKKLGVEVLSQEYTSTEEGLAAIKTLENWYQENYPDFYRENEIAVQKAVLALQDIFSVVVFPNLKVGWLTHPNNVGHTEFPGCFRCHDGKHTSPGGKTIRLECNICHSIPDVVGPGQPASLVRIGEAIEPESHKDSNWLARHRFKFDNTCAECHDVSNPGGTDNSSFCSNSACHATEWKYVGLNAPAIRELVKPPKTPGNGVARQVPHPIGPDTDCTVCHAADAVRPYPEGHASFDRSICTQCHRPPTLSQPKPTQAAPVEASPAVESATPATAPAATSTPAPAAGAPSAIPHPLEGRDDCLVCHGENGLKPYPADHVGRQVEICTMCHQVATPEAPAAEAPSTTTPTRELPTATPTRPAATATPTRPSTATSTPSVATATPTRATATVTRAGAAATATPTRRAATATPTRAAATATATSPAATSTPTVAATAEINTPTVVSTAEAGAALGPSIPHSVEDRADMCLICHGESGVKPFPTDHAGRTNDVCLTCHQEASQ